MTKKQKKTLLRILIAAALLLAAALADHGGLTLWLPGWLRLPFAVRVPGYDAAGNFSTADYLPIGWLYLIPYLVIGWDVLWKAVRNIAHGQIFDENFLMSIATVGAFATGEYPEATFVMLFYQVGELFQSYAVGKSRRSIASLMDIRPDCANIERDGALEQVDPDEVAVGDIIVIKPGERVPLDGTVIEGASSLDTAALTGESLPRDVSVGEDVVSGCVNLTGLLRVKVSKPFGESTVSRILDLVENSASKKARAENFITKFARYYTPAVVLGAVLLAVLPPLLGGGNWGQWFHQALVFLVVSCPCALVISVPLSFFGGIGGASRQGVLVKGGNYLEALANAGIVVFDKTGTLTKGVFAVSRVDPVGMTEAELLELTALAELYSRHPIAQSIHAAAPAGLDASRVSGVQELAGHGVKAAVDGRSVLAGSARLMASAGIQVPEVPAAGTTVHVAVDGKYAGSITVADQVKEGAAQALKELKAAGVRKTVMLTGDAPAAAEAVGRELALDEIHAGLLPADKVDRVEALLKAKAPREQLVFVGDGINDAPVLSRADIGVAMGALGSDAAIEAADIVLMNDDLRKLPAAVRIARRTLSIVRQNIAFALGVKALVLLLAALRLAGMWLAVFADVGVAVLAILNAMRALKTEKPPTK